MLARRRIASGNTHWLAPLVALAMGFAATAPATAQITDSELKAAYCLGVAQSIERTDQEWLAPCTQRPDNPATTCPIIRESLQRTQAQEQRVRGYLFSLGFGQPNRNDSGDVIAFNRGRQDQETVKQFAVRNSDVFHRSDEPQPTEVIQRVQSCVLFAQTLPF